MSQIDVMKKLESFYFVSALVGFVIDIASIAAFFGLTSLDFVVGPTILKGLVIIGVLSLFYGLFAFTSWRYWIWFEVYSERIIYFIQASDEWERDRKEWLENIMKRRKENEKKPQHPRAGGRPLHPIYEVPMPQPPRSYLVQGISLTVGLGILVYPLLAIWDILAIPDFIFFTSNIEFAFLLSVPFIFSGLAVITAVITVNGIQYFLG